MKHLIRSALLAFAHAVRETSRNQLAVLVYHRVAPHPPPDDPWTVSVAEFRLHLDIVSAMRFGEASLRDLESGAEHRGRRVLIAFDDGYRSAVEYAAPILRETDRLAAFFLVSGAMGATSDWELPFGQPPHPIMNWRDARDLVASGMSIGSHSVSHADLTAISATALVAEVRSSRERMEEEVGCEVRSFSVPFERDDGRADAALVAAGYRAKLTSRIAAARRSPIRAYGVSGVLQGAKERDIRLHLSGAADVLTPYYRLRRALRAQGPGRVSHQR